MEKVNEIKSECSCKRYDDNQLVNDPRIDSPDVKVIFPEDTFENIQGNDTPQPQEPETQVAKTRGAALPIDEIDAGMLDEVEVTPKKETTNPNNPIDNESFAAAIKQYWIPLTAIVIALGVLTFFIGRLTKKVHP